MSEIGKLKAQNDFLKNDRDGYVQLLTDQNTRLTAEVERLRAALETVMIGGNHLVSMIGATHPQTGSHYEAALQFYGPGHKYDAWCCWNAIMLARAALSGDKHE
jgi:hypothetical protein